MGIHVVKSLKKAESQFQVKNFSLKQHCTMYTINDLWLRHWSIKVINIPKAFEQWDFQEIWEVVNISILSYNNDKPYCRLHQSFLSQSEYEKGVTDFEFSITPKCMVIYPN